MLVSLEINKIQEIVSNMKKTISVCLFAASLAAFATGSLAQKPVATQINQEPAIRNDSTAIKRFTRFADALRAQPDATGYIFVYGGPATSAGETDAEIKRIRKYMVEHLRMDTNRIVIIDGGNRKTSQKEFWLVPLGADEPQPSPNMPPPAIKIDEYGTVNEETEMLKLDAFVVEIQNRPDVQGYIIVYGGRKRHSHDFDRTVKRMVNYLVGIRGADPARLIFVSGVRKKTPAYELWIVPPGSTPPVPSN